MSRWFNAIAGLWLIGSVLVWPHSASQFVIAWLVGPLIVGATLLAMRARTARYVNIMLAGWLLASAWALPVLSDRSMWNDVLVAITLIITTLISQAFSERDRSQRSSHSE